MLNTVTQIFNYLDNLDNTESNCISITSTAKKPQTKHQILKDHILNKVLQRTAAIDATIIENYLNIRIDNYHGVAPIKDLNINLNTFIKFTKMNENNATLLRREFIQHTSYCFKQDIHYVIHHYSNQGLKGTLEGADATARYQHIFISIETFIQLIFQSKSKNALTIKKYFIVMEELALEYMMDEITKQNKKHKINDESRIKQLRERIINVMMQNGVDVKQFSDYVDLILSLKCDAYAINIRTLFDITQRNEEQKGFFKTDFLLFLERNKLEYQERERPNSVICDVFISMNTLKFWLLSYDKNNDDVFDFRHYFIVMESIAIDALQKEMQTIIDWREALGVVDDIDDVHACYFYLIKLDGDTFKYGRATSLKLRKAAYDIGRLQQVSFYFYVGLDDCIEFEGRFSGEIEPYKIRGKHELIRLPENILMGILDRMLCEVNSD